MPARSVAAPPAPSRRFFSFRAPGASPCAFDEVPAIVGARSSVVFRAVKPSYRFPSVAHPAAFLVLCFAVSCTDTAAAPATDTTPAIAPGEICDPDDGIQLKLTFDPPTVVVAPNETRPVRLTVEPDICTPNTARIVSANPLIAEAPTEAKFDLRHATFDFMVKGDALGATTISAAIDGKDPNGKPYTLNVDLPIEVRDRTPPTCAPGGDASEGTVAAGATVLSPAGRHRAASVVRARVASCSKKHSPSLLNFTSHSNMRQPCDAPRRNAASVFSGASLPAPRCAIQRG